MRAEVTMKAPAARIYTVRTSISVSLLFTEELSNQHLYIHLILLTIPCRKIERKTRAKGSNRKTRRTLTMHWVGCRLLCIVLPVVVYN